MTRSRKKRHFRSYKQRSNPEIARDARRERGSCYTGKGAENFRPPLSPIKAINNLQQEVVFYKKKAEVETKQKWNAQRRNARLKKTLEAQKVDLKAVKAEAYQLQSTLAFMGKEIGEVRSAADNTVRVLEGRIANLEAQMKDLNHERKILKKRNKRLILAKQALKKQITEKKRNSPALFRLTYRGQYTAQARSLARLMVTTGTAEENVGLALSEVGEALGVSMGKRRMSRRSVQRFMLERGVAADMQIAYEIIKSGRKSKKPNSSGLTFFRVDRFNI